MKRFFCTCGQEIFTNNLYCPVCGRDVGFDPQSETIWTGVVLSDNRFHPHESKSLPSETVFKVCEHRFHSIACNWLINVNEIGACQCIACRTTRTIPNLNFSKNIKRWRALEKAKRHLFMTLLKLKLMNAENAFVQKGLKFDFLEDQRSNPNLALDMVLSGHQNGLITMNVAEADEGFLHQMKEDMGEAYRTLLGHFRHEIGHYYWELLIKAQQKETQFRQVFGDERADYAEALKTYYNKKHRAVSWMEEYISAYASSHPLEDWAETWAHYLHIVDTLETAVSYGLSTYEPEQHNFDNWYSEWGRVAQVMTALNQSMGLSDPYPFKISKSVEGKLRFIDEIINSVDWEKVKRGLDEKDIGRTRCV